MKTTSTKAAKAAEPSTNGNAHAVRSFAQIAIADIQPSAFEVQARRRSHFNDVELDELAASIKSKGLIQPIVVRPWSARPVETSKGTDYEPTYEIVCGERRYLASKRAGVEKIDALVRELSDIDALEILSIENLQRKDLDPIDEAFGYKCLLETGKYTVHDLSIKLGRTEKYIRQRIRLNELLPEILEQVSKGWLPLGHAMEIAKYPAETQREIHKEEIAWSDKWGNNPDAWEILKLADFKDELKREISLKLTDAGFDLEDASLHPEGLSCTGCSQRTGFEPLLFEEELKDGDSCLNRTCFNAKVLVQLTRSREAIAATLPNPKGLPVGDLVKEVPLVTDKYWSYGDENPFGKEKVLENQKLYARKECDKSKAALVVKGDKKGQQVYICGNPSKCSKHKEKSAGGSSSSSPTDWDLQWEEKKFQAKVANAVRLQVFKKAAEAFAQPFSFTGDEDLFNRMIATFWVERGYRVREILEGVIGEWKDYPKNNLHDRTKLIKFIGGLSNGQIQQLLFLLVFGGEGQTNHGAGDQQSGVKEVSEKYAQLDYRLIDAQVRNDLAPQKFKAKASEYLAAVETGKKDVKAPTFYWPRVKEEKKAAAKKEKVK